LLWEEQEILKRARFRESLKILSEESIKAPTHILMIFKPRMLQSMPPFKQLELENLLNNLVEENIMSIACTITTTLLMEL
jgi:hypothetical protein